MGIKFPDPYEVVEFRGRAMRAVDKAAILEMEHDLGYELTVIQAIGGAKASGGTHLQGRALDLASWDAGRKETVSRKRGHATWERKELPGVWGPHVHQITVFENRSNSKSLAPSGFRQIGLYDRGLDGLASMRKDPHPMRPEQPNTMTRARYELAMSGGLDAPPATRVTKMRDSMVEAIQSLNEAIALGRETDGRPAVDSAVSGLIATRRSIKERLTQMPPR